MTAITDRVTILATAGPSRTCAPPTPTRRDRASDDWPQRQFRVEKRQVQPGDALLKAVDVVIESPSGKRVVDGVSLTVRSGEIVGVAGVAGNGQNELVEALVGLRSPDSGHVEVCGARRDKGRCGESPAPLASPISLRIALPSAPRPRRPPLTNLAMGFHRTSPLARGLLVNPRAFAEQARALIRRFAIRIANERVNVGTLSGGNLQKIVVARELAHEALALIAEQPTRGLDVGATEHIHSAACRGTRPRPRGSSGVGGVE